VSELSRQINIKRETKADRTEQNFIFVTKQAQVNGSLRKCNKETLVKIADYE